MSEAPLAAGWSNWQRREGEQDVWLCGDMFASCRSLLPVADAELIAFGIDDGVEALDCLRNGACAESMPDLILLDINMPGMNGKECLKNLKHDEKFRMIPVSMLTSSQAPSDILECYRWHASCYVVKPFEAREFIKVVRQLVTFWSDVARPPSRAVW
jgi:CheY-like chemotaxis protein